VSGPAAPGGDGGPVVLINVFEVAPADQGRLLDLLDEAWGVMRTVPGIVSAHAHAGLAGDRVANYVVWRSEAEFRAMLERPDARRHMRAIGEIATSNPVLYRAGERRTADGG
jgi:heme-degrading monooxygenase HmoA